MSGDANRSYRFEWNRTVANRVRNNLIVEANDFSRAVEVSLHSSSDSLMQGSCQREDLLKLLWQGPSSDLSRGCASNRSRSDSNWIVNGASSHSQSSSSSVRGLSQEEQKRGRSHSLAMERAAAALNIDDGEANSP